MRNDFYIRTEGRFKKIFFHEVLYIKGRKNYCEFITATKNKFIIYGTIGVLESQLPENLFCRIHRSYIIAIDKIESFDHNFVFIGKEKIPLNKQGFNKIRERSLIIGMEGGNRASHQIIAMNEGSSLQKRSKLK